MTMVDGKKMGHRLGELGPSRHCNHEALTNHPRGTGDPLATNWLIRYQHSHGQPLKVDPQSRQMEPLVAWTRFIDFQRLQEMLATRLTALLKVPTR